MPVKNGWEVMEEVNKMYPARLRPVMTLCTAHKKNELD